MSDIMAKTLAVFVLIAVAMFALIPIGGLLNAAADWRARESRRRQWASEKRSVSARSLENRRGGDPKPRRTAERHE